MIWLADSDFGSVLVGTAELTDNQVITCWSLGFGSILIYPLAKLIPMNKLKFLSKIDLEQDPNSSKVL